MGCDNSKTIRVQPLGTPAVNNNKLTTEGSKRQTSKGESGHPDLNTNKVKSKNSRQRSAVASKNVMGSSSSLDDERSLDSDRGFSATSKQSADSGLGEEYAHVITEFSEEDKIRQVENDFAPRDGLELTISGTQCATRLSAKDRNRLDESHILQVLREEGLISKPQFESSGGMCFEIIDASEEGRVRLPPRLEKLERRRKKKKVLTEDEIREKLERADRRRKNREQEKLDKLREMERVDALAALENFTQYQRSKEEHISQKMEQVTDNRERKLREVKDKLEKRRRHAEEVRKRKQLALESTGNNDENAEAEVNDENVAEEQEVTSGI